MTDDNSRVFRRAMVEDVLAIVDLHRLPHVRDVIGSEPIVANIIARLDDPEYATFVLERDTRVVGFALIEVEDGWLGTLRRLISARPGNGDGTIMMMRALRYCFEVQSCHRIYVEVLAANTNARRFYERFGFSLEGTWRDGYRHTDGSYSDLCAYGLLRDEYLATTAQA